MQTTKFLFAIGAAAILTAPLQVTAGPDSEAQAKMREALRQKMEELNAQAAPAPAPVPVAPVAPVPATPPAAVVKPAQPKPAPAPVVIAPTVVVPVPAEPVAAPVPAAPVKAKTTDSRFTEVPVESDEAQAARMREVLRQKIAAEKAAIAVATPTPAPAPAPAAAPTVSAPAKPAAVVQKPAAVQPIATNIEAAPSSPFSGSKQERLAALLQLYKADTITPQQYHTQRAAIIAEP